jgi:hypothetical protein
MFLVDMPSGGSNYQIHFGTGNTEDVLVEEAREEHDHPDLPLLILEANATIYSGYVEGCSGAQAHGRDWEAQTWLSRRGRTLAAHYRLRTSAVSQARGIPVAVAEQLHDVRQQGLSSLNASHESVNQV